MKKINILKISALVVLTALTVLAFAGCDKKTDTAILNDAKTCISAARTELASVKSEALKLEADTSAAVHTAITDTDNSLKKVEAIIATGADTAAADVKAELVFAKVELDKLKAEAKTLEADTEKEIHTFIENAENKIADAEKALEGK